MTRVGYFGTWERGYPRNEQVISCLRGAGATVEEIHEEVWSNEHKFALGARLLPRLAAAELRLARRRVTSDVVLVGYPGQFDLWAAKRTGKPVAFNAMLSLHETLVDDRNRFSPGSMPSRALAAVDRLAFRAADLLVADTAANASAMAEFAGLEHVEHVFVGAEERLFQPSWQPPERFVALFVGKLIPLHGLETILAAARLVPEITFRIVGSGQQAALLHELPRNVEHLPWVDYSELPREYARAGCALGIFGTSRKVERVIPNKAFQALAVGTPLVTADTPAARELLQHENNALLIDRSAEALAAAVELLARDRALAARIAASGRATFERAASEAVLGRRWLGLLRSLE